MWYQSSISDTDTIGLKAYKGSEFAELTFDHDPGMGPITTTSPWQVTQVVCHGRYDNSTTALTPLVHRKEHVGPIVQRFAVYLKDSPTCFKVDCSFEYFSLGYNTSACVNTSKLFVIERDEDYDNKPSSVCQEVTVKPFGQSTVVNYISTKCDQNSVCKSMLSLPIDELSAWPSQSSVQDIFICQVRDIASTEYVQHFDEEA
ncbi:hypothetical protein THRCLA_11731 [Thraustotheca clavata]|uniref:Uncharacterized protein n=1 Tax=Thraustotheca clavata TaxID=74557 RepID=A0A1V9Y6V1_9STRA|nr:hypothetical protein THRCLA_11731 [Thraustotheca clavata]